MSDSEAKYTMENAQEDSVEYNKFYIELTLRVLHTIMYSLDFIQTHVENYGMPDQMDNIRNGTGYIDMLEKIFNLVQQFEEKDKRKRKMTKQTQDKICVP